ncbi:shieldin complex subunit 3 [Mastacembelus armatus]|uniref:Uncharacterized LOC113138931 n=1 Tax=Mastacembelus armatus TaxID=205130 RepID=A0A3Q3N4M5_9TELE|nr:shieldin complex subunit 3 [Mastacembelus armatus]
MEDVVLHYQPGSAAGLLSLVERTEKLLEPFRCRTPPVFTPWFPTSTADLRLPIRPAKPAPVITSVVISDSRSHTETEATVTKLISESELQKPNNGRLVSETPHDIPHTGSTRTPLEKALKSKEYIPRASNHLLPASPCNKLERDISGLPSEKQLQKDKDGFTVTDCPIKRSWSVFTHGGVLMQSSQSLSKQFRHLVSIHRLHLRQRAKWVICEHNCGAFTDIEQVWHALSRSVRSSRLPTCNANIQRERSEIWVFCDIIHSEQVGRFLKDELRLSGRISLSVRRLGNIFSM